MCHVYFISTGIVKNELVKNGKLVKTKKKLISVGHKLTLRCADKCTY